MGSDLFGSFAESTCAALVVSSTSAEIVGAGWAALMFPLTISALGIFACLVVSFIATDVWPVRKEVDVENVLKVQIGVSTLVMTAFLFPLSYGFLPSEFTIGYGTTLVVVHPYEAYLCACSGLWGGCLIGFITEFFTSHTYKPTRELAKACTTGAATNIIYGLALGYKSVIAPIVILAVIIYVSFFMAGMYGIALAALGMLSTLATCLTIDVYGPVCDNAGGIAEMSALPHECRDKTDALDAAGNTTAAIGKGFAIGSAALVSLALFGAFVTRVNTATAGMAGGSRFQYGVNILHPITFACLIMGAMLPYWFTALTMKSVGTAAFEMVHEIQRQFNENPHLLDEGTTERPDTKKCIEISTQAALKEMIFPGLLVMIAPIFTGVLFGVQGVAGLLSGALVSAVQLAISAANSGGAWDNAKKFVEKGCVSIVNEAGETVVQGKGTDVHKASVVGDTVGDPLKDTSGPALNILMKLMAIISLVFADFFCSIQQGRGLTQVPV